MSQRARVLSFIALVVLPLVALSGWRLWQERGADERSAAAEQVGMADAAALATQGFVEGHLSTVRSLAVGPTLAQGTPGPGLDPFLARVASANPAWRRVAILDPQGRTLASSDARPFPAGEAPYLRQALATGEPVVGAARAEGAGSPKVVLAAPLGLKRGADGVLVVSLSVGQFADALSRLVGANMRRVTVVDAQGHPFVGRDRPLAGTLHASASASVRVGTGADERVLAYAPVPAYGWTVMVSEPAAVAFAGAREQAREHAAELGLILAAVAVLGWVLASRLAQLFERLEAVQRDLEQALRTRDDFLAAAAHDLRNPLAAIRAAVDVLQHPRTALAGERFQSCVSHIDAASRRINGLIDAFLDVARLQVGRPLALDLEPVDLVPLVRQLVEECRQSAPRHRIVLEGPPVLHVQADGARLARVVGNLLGNAVKYSPGGGEVRVRLWATGGEALIQVRDQGIGIPAADLERVFERFQRGSNVVGQIPGTGIGLAAARHIVEQHGGTIAVESAPGAGSAFTVRLPVRASVEGSMAA